MSSNTADTSAQERVQLLVVEDDVVIRDFCRRLLRTHYDVDSAEDGKAATELLSQKTYDLILSDLHMPRMNGIELLQYVRQHHADTDVIILTAYAAVDTARNALKLGALDYLAKPMEAENLERTVRTALELRRVRREKERLSDMVFMYQFSQAIAVSLDIASQVEQITAFLWQRFSPETLVVSLVEPETHHLVLLIAKSAHAPVTIVSQALPLPAECDDDTVMETHRRLVDHAAVAQDGLCAGALLRTHDHSIGYIHLARSADQPLFDANDCQLLGIFASQVAASLDNARLYSELKDQNHQTIEALSEAIEARDAYTHGHSRQVTRYAVRLGEALGLPPQQIELITYAGLLHDVGKIGIRDYILLKPEALSATEFTIMKRHPRIGRKIIERVRGLHATLPIIEAHHEQYDGGGYPDGLAGEAIPYEARILAVADAFDAMTSDRAYRRAMETERALEVLVKGSGKKWDPAMVEAFVAIIRTEGRSLRSTLKQQLVPLIVPDNGYETVTMDVRD